MTDDNPELDAALEKVVEAARAHLTAVRAAGGRLEDDGLWQAYVGLNNAIYAYDSALLDEFGEVTPWTVEAIDPDEADQRFGLSIGGLDGAVTDEPYPQVISVRQRRDYRVPGVRALLRTAQAARQRAVPEDADPGTVETVGEAVLELLQTGDGTLAALDDVIELEPVDGILTVSEVGKPLDPDAFADDDTAGPFTPASDEVVIGRLGDHFFFPEEEDD